MIHLLAHGDWPPGDILDATESILRDVHLCTLSTAGPEGEAHGAPLFFARSEDLDLIFLSKPGTKHAQNIRTNPVCAITVFDSRQLWGSALRGLRLFGRAVRLDGEIAEGAGVRYAERFPEYAKRLGGMDIERRFGFGAEFFLFRPERLELMDEMKFPNELHIPVRVIHADG